MMEIYQTTEIKIILNRIVYLDPKYKGQFLKICISLNSLNIRLQARFLAGPLLPGKILETSMMEDKIKIFSRNRSVDYLCY
jgi:hypothetical protein